MPLILLRFPHNQNVFRSLVALLFTTVLLAGGMNARPAKAFVPYLRWEDTANGATGARGTPTTLRWSIVPDGTEIRGGETSELIHMMDEWFAVSDRSTPLSSRPWMSLFNSAFERWGDVGGVQFEYEPHDDGATHRQSPGELFTRGDIRLAAKSIDGSRGVLASGLFPDGGDITIDTDGPGYLLDPADNYLRFRNVLMHEIGHTLGLEHVVSSDAQLLMEPELTLGIDGPQLDDIRGLHYLYGDRFERSGNNTQQQATPLGTLPLHQTLTIGGDAGTSQFLAPDATDFLSISGQSDRDFFSFTIEQAGYLDAVLTPAGGQFHQSAIGGVEYLTDASASSNLNLALLDSEGRALAALDESLHGGLETLDHFYVDSPGTYFLRVRGTRDTVQLYSLSVCYQRSTSIPEPTSMSLIVILSCSANLLNLMRKTTVR